MNSVLEANLAVGWQWRYSEREMSLLKINNLSSKQGIDFEGTERIEKLGPDLIWSIHLIKSQSVSTVCFVLGSGPFLAGDVSLGSYGTLSGGKKHTNADW